MAFTTPIIIRPEHESDYGAVAAVNDLAFERESEGRLVAGLRQRPETLSLVACSDDEVLGHILFSIVTVGNARFASPALGLGPMSVLPDRQSQGIGTQLVAAGLTQCRERGTPFVVVLGHPDYYPRFGFVPASRYGLRCRWPVPDEVFLVQELEPGALKDLSGVVEYAPEFSLL